MKFRASLNLTALESRENPADLFGGVTPPYTTPGGGSTTPVNPTPLPPPTVPPVVLPPGGIPLPYTLP